MAQWRKKRISQSLFVRLIFIIFFWCLLHGQNFTPRLIVLEVKLSLQGASYFLDICTRNPFDTLQMGNAVEWYLIGKKIEMSILKNCSGKFPENNEKLKWENNYYYVRRSSKENVHFLPPCTKRVFKRIRILLRCMNF